MPDTPLPDNTEQQVDTDTNSDLQKVEGATDLRKKVSGASKLKGFLVNKLLKNKYNLHTAPEVTQAAKRTEQKTGEKVSQNPEERIQNYLNRFKDILDRGGEDQRERNLDRIKYLFHSKYVIKPNEIPESYFDLQRRIAREQGHGDVEITKEMRAQLTEVIITDQKTSLDAWINYLSSPDAPYSDALKYFALRSILSMGEYDKKTKSFTNRSKGTVKPFPELNREALAYVVDVVEKKYKGDPLDLSNLKDSEAQELNKLLQGENFAKLYAFAIEKVTPASPEDLANIQGKWVKYDRGSDHMPLVQSLQGHGTGWCTAGESTAAIQLQGGDFYVYYSNDKDGKPTIPRAAIRMDDNKIGEVRGIGPDQNLDNGAEKVVEEKLKEFPDGKEYQKKVADMKHLTEIENKVKENVALTQSDLIFLYEAESPIQGFGYDEDPRIAEIRSQRNPKEDMPIFFGCSADEIATNVDEISPNTKAYVGPLEKGIFDRLPKDFEHIYISFPEGKVRMRPVEVGGKTREQLLSELEENKMGVAVIAKEMILKPEFTTLPNPEILYTVEIPVEGLGLNESPTTDEIYKKALSIGLDLCPAELGPHLRLAYKNQEIDDEIYLAMKQITDAKEDDLRVFSLNRNKSGEMWLRGTWADPKQDRWGDGHNFVFVLPKKD